ncbi:MAG: multidrug ABC transporter substrate-binding protein [Gemmatimonadetes bacterium 13_1_20CM_4_66_11]|nr:MAG: multidrug ABC transporter substrate-binding protein [Gemmatimonadetes bacterium 13_1_20CM_4_66_11]
MLLGEIFQVALQAIRANKLRSFLTMLGIIIGVGAVITMVALGSGAQKAVQERIQALGPTLLSLYPGQSFRGGIMIDFGSRVSLTVDDANALASSARYVKAVVPELTRNLQIKKGGQNANVNIVGTTPNYPVVKNYTLTAGRMFTAGEDEGRRRLAVLGSAIPDMFNANPGAMIGQEIQIRGIPFEIVGVLSSKGSAMGFGNPDEQVLIPLQTARYRIMGTDRLRTITVDAANVQQMTLSMIEIERVLRREHKIRPGAENDFQIRNQSDILATFQQTTQTFTYLLAGIAAVSLLVGGIGIMNIMLVSVTERTREIGVRKALGATRFNILFQFLVEALVLCLVGGIIGILFGALGAVALSKLAHWNTSINFFAIVVAFVFSAIVGLFFGIWPARRAAALDPIVALRYE